MTKWKKQIKFAAAALLLVILLTGGKYRDISKAQEVVGFSIDPSSGGKYTFGLELAMSGKGKDFTVTSKTISVEARDLREALRQAGLMGEYPLRMTGSSLLVVNAALLGGQMNKISEMLLQQWEGSADAFVAVAEESRAIEILQSGEHTDLRSGQLSAQIRRGYPELLPLRRCLSRYLSGETVSLPLVRVGEDNYRITGSIQIRGV